MVAVVLAHLLDVLGREVCRLRYHAVGYLVELVGGVNVVGAMVIVKIYYV